MAVIRVKRSTSKTVTDGQTMLAYGELGIANDRLYFGDHNNKARKLALAADIWTIAGGDLTGNYPNPIIGDGKVTIAKLSQEIKTSLSKANTALQQAPVISVNGHTGAVTIPVPTFSVDGTTLNIVS